MKNLKKISNRLQKKLSKKTENTSAEIISTTSPTSPTLPSEEKKLLIADILNAAININPDAFDGIDEKQSLSIAKSLFQILNIEINNLSSGSIILPNFGRFIVKQSINQKDGMPNIHRRIFCQIQDKK